jgi:hypothetical protein
MVKAAPPERAVGHPDPSAKPEAFQHPCDPTPLVLRERTDRKRRIRSTESE